MSLTSSIERLLEKHVNRETRTSQKGDYYFLCVPKDGKDPFIEDCLNDIMGLAENHEIYAYGDFW